MKTYFPNGTYNTPPVLPGIKVRKSLLSFYSSYAGIVLKARADAVKGVFDDDAWAESSNTIFKLIEKHGGKFQITGIRNILDIKGPSVFIGNHMGTLETQILPVLIAPFKPVTFVVKESLVKGTLFGPIMRSRDPIVVTRKDPGRDLRTVLEDGVKILAQGTSVVIFPQHTRAVEFNPEQFNSLGVKLAAKAGVPCIPVALKTDFWANGAFIKELGKIDPSKFIHFSFGKPIHVTGRGKKEHMEIVQFIQSHLAKWE